MLTIKVTPIIIVKTIKIRTADLITRIITLDKLVVPKIKGITSLPTTLARMFKIITAMVS